jgi:hypothetical protein
MSEAAAAAAQAILNTGSSAAVTTPDGPLPDDAPPVKFDRLSVERRALCAISDELYSDRLGPRNSLPAIADFLINDPNTTNPPPPNARLEVAGLPLADQVQLVLDNLDRLIEAGLATREGDVNDPTHTYHVTEAGVLEMQN